ncbi:MAG: hypothetical protein H5U30_07280, partial [Marinobacter sp.]|nr:hypothetical protein [Marinobacter sp.]
AVVQNRNVQHFQTIADVNADTGTTVGDTGETTGGTTSDTTSDTTSGTTSDTTSGGTVADTGTQTSEPPATDTTTGTTTGTTTEVTIPANAALLSWTAPLTRENGESLAMGEIAGYEVVYGTSADNLDNSLAIGDASVDELLVDELTQGTWYFAIRTLDTDGNRSRLSEVVYKQI